MKIDNVFMIQNIYFLVCMYKLFEEKKPTYHNKCNLIFGPCETILATFPVKLPNSCAIEDVKPNCVLLRLQI